jgi:hypothetical protein
MNYEFQFDIGDVATLDGESYTVAGHARVARRDNGQIAHWYYLDPKEGDRVCVHVSKIETGPRQEGGDVPPPPGCPKPPC